MYDVAVVGGSIAGAATSAHLASAGYRVVILEQSPAHRRKACGEGLFPRGVTELSRLGLLGSVSPVAQPLAGVRFRASPAGAAACFAPSTGGGLGIERSRLDPLLLQRAVDAGAELLRGVAARSLVFDGDRLAGVRTDREEIRARVVVGADGIGSRVRRLSGLDRPKRGGRYGVSAHIELKDAIEPFVDVHFRHGYEVYVTPVGGQTVNVAVLFHKRLLGRPHGDLQRWFAGMVAPALGEAGQHIVDVPLAAGPFGSACTRPWCRNTVLVGDAAGFFDAVSGEGMSSALISARYCANAVKTYLETGDEGAFRRYARQQSVLLRNSDLLARLTLALTAQPAIAQLAVRELARRPGTFARLIGISCGELPLHALRPPDALALLPAVLANARKRRG